MSLVRLVSGHAFRRAGREQNESGLQPLTDFVQLKSVVCRVIEVLSGDLCKPPLHRILRYVLQDTTKMFRVINPHLREASLPNRRPEAEFLAGAKCKAAFDELNCSFNADFRTDCYQDM